MGQECFITLLVRDCSRAEVTPNSFPAPAELPVGKLDSELPSGCQTSGEELISTTAPHPHPSTLVGRAKVSQEAWRQRPESWPVDTKWWALRHPAGQARSHLQVFAPAVSSAWPSLLDLWPLDLCPAHSFLLFGLISKVTSSQTTLLSVV